MSRTHRTLDQDPSTGIISRTGNYLRKKRAAIVLVGTLALAGCADDDNVGVPTGTPTPTVTSEVQPTIAPPDMQPAILTPDQIAKFESDDLNAKSAVIGKTLIPAIQSYIDNLMLNRDDMESVDSSSVTLNPDSSFVSSLQRLVRNEAGDPEAKPAFIVCGTDLASNPEICDGHNFSSIYDLDGFDSSINIVRSDLNDPYGLSPENKNIPVQLGDGDVVSLTPEGQIVVND